MLVTHSSHHTFCARELPGPKKTGKNLTAFTRHHNSSRRRTVRASDGSEIAANYHLKPGFSERPGTTPRVVCRKLLMYFQGGDEIKQKDFKMLKSREVTSQDISSLVVCRCQKWLVQSLFETPVGGQRFGQAGRTRRKMVK